MTDLTLTNEEKKQLLAKMVQMALSGHGELLKFLGATMMDMQVTEKHVIAKDPTLGLTYDEIMDELQKRLVNAAETTGNTAIQQLLPSRELQFIPGQQLAVNCGSIPMGMSCPWPMGMEVYGVQLADNAKELSPPDVSRQIGDPVPHQPTRHEMSITKPTTITDVEQPHTNPPAEEIIRANRRKKHLKGVSVTEKSAPVVKDEEQKEELTDPEIPN